MRKPLISKSAVALAAGFTCLAANAFVVGVAGPVNGVNAATVLEQNTRGIGHMLVVPYYTAQNGNDTYLSIVNTDMRNGKAVKVRFRGASNSDDVLDFTVYLSPGDVWTAAVTKPANQDLPILLTNDRSCTHPAIPAAGVPFITARLHQGLTAAQQASETREGYVEIFNMADIPPNAGAVAANVDTLYKAIEHVNGVPRDCNNAVVNNLLNAPLNTAYAAALVGAVNTAGTSGQLGLEVPTTGLMANWSVVNVPSAASWSGSAWAVEARVAAGGAAGFGNVVFHPQTNQTTGLGIAANGAAGVRADTISERTADPLLRGGNTTNTAAEVPTLPARVAFGSYDLPDMSTPYLFADIANLGAGIATKQQAARLTAALASTSIANEYSTLVGLRGATDWTFTMPTRRYNVARAYTGTANAGAESTGDTLFTNLDTNDAGAAIAAPTVDYFISGTNVVSNTTVGKRHQLCVTGISFAGGAKGGAEGTNRTTGVTADREERFVGAGTPGAVFSPGVPGTPASFCGEASVLAFNAANQPSTLGSEVARREIATEQPEGWVRFSTPGAVAGRGLPVIGYSFVQLTNNAAAPGVRGNYGLAWEHRSTN